MARTPAQLKTVAVVLTAVLAVWSVYLALTFFSLTRQVGEQRVMLHQEQALSTELQQAQATAGKLRNRVLTHAASWSWSDQLPLTIGQVSLLVKHSGVRVESMQPAPVVEAEKLVRFPLRVVIHGDLVSLVTFLRFARQQSPALGVDQLTLHTGTQATDPLRAEITLSSYVMLDRAAGGEKP